LEGLREVPGVNAPVSQTIVMIDGRYGAVATTPRVHTRAIFTQIEERFGITITEAHQEIEATLITAAQAEMLQSEPGAPALLITRRFFGAGRTLVSMSRNLHASSRFRYSMTVRRDR
jgi:DNA-binding GntR family transcriptional regulator